MGKIKLLDESIINKIAAGEVIDRPASIVKELVENSVDADSNAITIEIEEGGKSLIRVSDNGCGISDDDIEHVFQRHATSKIKSSEDLFDIYTLGFRGEAMASIAAVSEIELTTCTSNTNTGCYLRIKGGKIIDKKSLGFPEGTSISVRNLFYNTPARFKFLKSDLSEQGQIADIVQKLALSNSTISIKLIMNGKTILHTPGNGDLLSVIHCIYGKKISKNMLLLEYKNQIVNIDGFIGKPEISKGNSTFIIFSVNNRVIKNRMLIEAVRQAYKTLLMNNKFPFAIINIDIKTDKIDVNVHPTKAEIKFSDDRAIFNTIYVAVKNCLNTSDLLFGNDTMYNSDSSFKTKATNNAERTNEQYEQQKFSTSHITANDETYKNITPVFEQQLLSKNITKLPYSDNTETIYSSLESNNNDNKSFVKEHIVVDSINNDKTKSGENKSKGLPDLRIIGQLFSTYILTQSSDSFYIIDQHAAHERIMYEYLLKKHDTGDITIQQLLMPIVLELSPKEVALLNNSFSLFQNLGFELEWFGDNSIAIRSIPIIMGEPCSGEFFSDIIADIESDNKKHSSPKEKMIVNMSCKSSIKAGDKLSIEEMEELIKRLALTNEPSTCPHGRPTIISMSLLEIEKKFKRVL